MPYKFELHADEDLFNIDPARYLITPDNNTLHFANITVELPVNWHRVPFKPYSEGTVLVHFKGAGIGHGLLYRRIDTFDDDILFKVGLSAYSKENEGFIPQEHYLREYLTSPPDEKELFRGSFALNGGRVHFLKTEHQNAAPFTTRYRSLFFVDSTWDGPVLFVEHYVRVEERPFRAKSFESDQEENISDILFKNLKTVKMKFV